MKPGPHLNYFLLRKDAIYAKTLRNPNGEIRHTFHTLKEDRYIIYGENLWYPQHSRNPEFMVWKDEDGCKCMLENINGAVEFVEALI